MTTPVLDSPAPGTSEPNNVHIWETGDLYIWTGPAAPVAGTDIPADPDEELDTADGKWGPAGLMLGDPGFELTHDIDETDLNAWQLKRFRTKYKNGRVDGSCTLYEDNDVVEDIVDSENVPSAKARYVAMVLWDSDTGHREFRFTTAKAYLFAENDSQSEEPKGRPIRFKFFPDKTGKIFTIRKGIPLA